MYVAILTATAHKVPHECLQANHLVGGPQSVPEGLIQRDVSRSNGRMWDTQHYSR